MNEERTGKWLRKVEHIRVHLWHRYSIRECIPCNSNYSLKHVLIDYVDVADDRPTFYNVNNLYDLLTKYYNGFDVNIRSRSWYVLLYITMSFTNWGLHFVQFAIRRVWRYKRGNQNPYIEEEQTTQWPKMERKTFFLDSVAVNKEATKP
jgi:hypothetical protein